MDELNKEVNVKITLGGWFHTLKRASHNFSVPWVPVIKSVITRQRWPCCTVHKVHSWSLCAASRISRVLMQWEMSCCPFTPGGVFGSSGITVLWWLTKKMCVIWALFLIQLQQLQEVCVRQGVLPACCLMSLLLRQIDWKLKYFFSSVTILMELLGTNWAWIHCFEVQLSTLPFWQLNLDVTIR